MSRLLAIILCLFLPFSSLSLSVLSASAEDLTSAIPPPEEPAPDALYEPYAQVLSRYVDDRGLVDYRALKEQRAALDRFLETLARLSRERYDSWNREAQIAFWINAYNALTLKSIIDAYPIKPGLLASLAFPKNSIRQIDGVWDERQHQLLGIAMTLDQIEHQVLREQFKEARVHVALVCAAMSCPPLRQEPYRAEKLDSQLADQAQRFFASDAGLQFEDSSIAVSKIFDWFGKDLLWRYPEAVTEKAALLRYLREHLDRDRAAKLEDRQPAIDFLKYDWSLNEQAAQ